jgi:hypothetical protein
VSTAGGLGISFPMNGSPAHYGPWPGQPPLTSGGYGEPWPANLAGQDSTRQPPAGVLVGASLWALALGVAGAVTGAAALITVAGDPPMWYPPAILATGAVSLIGAIGGLRLVEVAWLRWKLLALGTAAITVTALLTVAAITGLG